MVAFLLGAAPLAQIAEAAQNDSIEVIRTRANAGDIDAQYNLAFMYSNGEDIPQDYVEAMAWYRKAAEQGDANALANIAWMYRNGHGVPEDDVEAVAWYRKAAEQGHAAAQFDLGVMHA